VAQAPIELDLDWLDRKIGRAVDPAEVHSILTSLAFGVTEPAPRMLTVTVPSWRATKDISQPVDLVEEIGRMIGYSSIPPLPPMVPTAVPQPSPQREFIHQLRAQATAQGFTEVYNYSFLSDKQVTDLGLDVAAHVRVLNPIASDQALMRTSLIPGILKNLQDNARHFHEFRLFEIGNEILKKASGLPTEVPHLAAACYAKEGDGQGSLFELKRLAECLAGAVTIAAAEPRSFEHPARTFAVSANSHEVGRLFEFHPNAFETKGEGRGAVLDLDLHALETARPKQHRYQALRRFPSSAFDLSILAAMREPVGKLESLIHQRTGPELLAVEFVRQYMGAPLPEDRKSVSYRVTVGAEDRTLSSDEIGAIRSGLIEALQTAGYELRV
jgi:phenylalanyl-tRNA synthetase beta chain